MWHLLYDLTDEEFELFHDSVPNSVTYRWFDLSSTAIMFSNAAKYKHDVHTWISDEFYEHLIFILHSFPTQPTRDEVIAVIHSHPELLI